MKRLAQFALLQLCAVWLFAAGGTVRVALKESDELFANPGMGWQTFHRFADEDANLKGLPSGSAYFRFYWREIEKNDGAIDFERFDNLLAHAKRAKQKLAFRVMCTGSGEYMDVPQWLKEKGCAGVEFVFEGKHHWVPDFEHPVFKSAHSRLIQELGKRYDGHPDLDLVDIGSVGLWGEWHMSSTKDELTGKPVPLPSLETRLAIIDQWCNAFPKTSKVILVGSEEGMAQAVQKRYGWRADCLGDMGGFSKNWNHMQNFYLQQLAKTHAEDAWQRAPVAFESCWDMRKWKKEGWDINYIFDYALRCHASYLNNKSAPIPEGTQSQIERFLKRLGYRIVVRNVEYPHQIKAGMSGKIRIDWENIGVAPPYRVLSVAFQLKPKIGSSAGSQVIPTSETIRGWLPGKRESELALNTPNGTAAGLYELSLGITEADGKVPAVRLANQNIGKESWLSLGDLEVAPK